MPDLFLPQEPLTGDALAEAQEMLPGSLELAQPERHRITLQDPETGVVWASLGASPFSHTFGRRVIASYILTLGNSLEDLEAGAAALPKSYPNANGGPQ
jgi:hypothetical protein